MGKVNKERFVGVKGRMWPEWARPIDAAAACGLRKSRPYELLDEASGEITSCVLKSPGAVRGARLDQSAQPVRLYRPSGKAATKGVELMKTREEPTAEDRGFKLRQDSKANICMLAATSSKFKGAPRLPILRGLGIGQSIVVHRPFCDKLNAHGWDPKLTERDVYYLGG